MKEPGGLLLAVLRLSGPGAHNHLVEGLERGEADLEKIEKLDENWSKLGKFRLGEYDFDC